MAESEGFEPPDPFGSTVFKTAAFDHSASSPDVILDYCVRALSKAETLAYYNHLSPRVINKYLQFNLENRVFGRISYPCVNFAVRAAARSGMA